LDLNAAQLALVLLTMMPLCAQAAEFVQVRTTANACLAPTDNSARITTATNATTAQVMEHVLDLTNALAKLDGMDGIAIHVISALVLLLLSISHSISLPTLL
jgi:hypothetical protein